MIIKEKNKSGQELNTMEKQIEIWYYNIMANKPYYSLDEIKKLKLI